MKRMISAALLAASFMPFAAFAQSATSHVTRAQVRAELVQLESVGYNPAVRDENYPQALQTAEAKVAARYGENAAYGGVSTTTDAAGIAQSAATPK
ncbi:hypothetical protein BVER_02703c [Candidatus Burkholderia verschuerenii]|uniref:Purine nucleoside phosphorylase n=1 Tax=Candidatus Burkholderia verschuerenii TaxID=242163 RepID=A0A0L0M3V7_9BURK|nr:DUF4148 domain-containing protein [Candidatus Burkholderia verschuerenii]KND56955.1 hypothetical protein BVER_02703c [Candidatus Burkholderia verschuerenii]